MMQTLGPAIERFREFLQSLTDGDVIHEDSGFTAADGREILADLEGRYTPAKPDAGFATNGE